MDKTSYINKLKIRVTKSDIKFASEKLHHEQKQQAINTLMDNMSLSNQYNILAAFNAAMKGENNG